ncbi:MAG: hydrolase [Clostridia bacterium]|nr:hydrolase [Clostridia bacterium]
MDRFTLQCEEAILLIIDIQERLMPVMKYGDQVINKTNILIAVAKRLGMPIVFTEQYPKGLGRTVPEVADNLAGAVCWEKMTFSACTPELMEGLAQAGRRKVIITGMETHVCVFQTVRGLLQSGYQVFLAGDAICSRTKENWRNGLALMQAMGAVITNTETVFFDLMQQAGTPEFKELSKLIK